MEEKSIMVKVKFGFEKKASIRSANDVTITSFINYFFSVAPLELEIQFFFLLLLKLKFRCQGTIQIQGKGTKKK